MKNVITLLSCAVALVMTSCTLSNEEKAEKLVKETLKDYLYHPDSYEPISTKVDSMFIDVTTIEPIMKISEDIKDLMSKINRCKMKVESAESSMDIFAPNGYSSQYSRGEYARAKKEKEEAKSDLDKYTKKLSEQLVSLTSNPQPIGFSGILLAKRQNSFYCTYFLHNRNVEDTKSPYHIKRLEVIRWFNQKSMVFNQSLS